MGARERSDAWREEPVLNDAKQDAASPVSPARGAIEQAINLLDHGDIDIHVIKADAAQELKALREQASAHDRYISNVHARTVEASAAYNEAHGITDGRWPDLGELLRWLLAERAEKSRLHDAAYTAYCNLADGSINYAMKVLDAALHVISLPKEEER